MWYLATVLFAQPQRPGVPTVVCETSQVLFVAGNAAGAYEKAREWGQRRIESTPGFELAGVQALKPLGLDRPPQDGDEIDGRVWESDDVWVRLPELVPAPEQLAAFVLEQEGRLAPVLSEEERRLVERTIGQV
jgi:hypothetical protein